MSKLIICRILLFLLAGGYKHVKMSDLCIFLQLGQSKVFFMGGFLSCNHFRWKDWRSQNTGIWLTGIWPLSLSQVLYRSTPVVWWVGWRYWVRWRVNQGKKVLGTLQHAAHLVERGYQAAHFWEWNHHSIQEEWIKLHTSSSVHCTVWYQHQMIHSLVGGWFLQTFVFFLKGCLGRTSWHV